MRSFYIAALLFCGLALASQQTPTFVTTGTTAIGASAISISTIVAKTYRLSYPFYDYQADSASGLLFFSARQKAENGTLYLNRNFMGALNMAQDSLHWLFESVLYDIDTPGDYLFFSNPERSNRYNKSHGFEDHKYLSRLLYTVPAANRGLTYKKAGSDVLSGIDLVTDSVAWTATVPSGENWVDTRQLNDSLLLVASGGLYGINLYTGLQWSYPSSTATKVTKALTYSLANNNPSIRRISRVLSTSQDENSVTELSSNILVNNGVAYFASRERLIAVAADGRLLWELGMKDLPVSKMLLYKKGGTLVLVNFGLAQYAGHYVIYGSPFVLSIDPESGKIRNRSDLGSIENLVDFTITDKSLMFAGKNTVLEVKEGRDEVEVIQKVDAGSIGNFSEFIDGSRYYVEKEGFYVSLNFLNDNLVYFKADNNKIYGFSGSEITYEYHLSDIYRLEKKFDNKLLLANDNKSLLVSSNFELLYTFNTADTPLVGGNRIFFIGEQQVRSVDLRTLK